MVGKHRNPRLDLLCYMVVLIIAALIARLGYLQIAKGAEFHQQADNNRIRLMPVMAPR